MIKALLLLSLLLFSLVSAEDIDMCAHSEYTAIPKNSKLWKAVFDNADAGGYVIDDDILEYCGLLQKPVSITKPAAHETIVAFTSCSGNSACTFALFRKVGSDYVPILNTSGMHMEVDETSCFGGFYDLRVYYHYGPGERHDYYYSFNIDSGEYELSYDEIVKLD